MEFISNLIKRPISLVMSEEGDNKDKDKDSNSNSNSRQNLLVKKGSKSMPTSPNLSNFEGSEEPSSVVNGLLWRGTASSGSTGNLSSAHYPEQGGFAQPNLEALLSPQQAALGANSLAPKLLNGSHWMPKYSSMEQLLVEIGEELTPPSQVSKAQVWYLVDDFPPFPLSIFPFQWG